MVRLALILTALFVVATPAAAQATVLHTTMGQPNDVQSVNSDYADSTNRLAQSFTPTQSGAAHLVSFYAQTQMGGGFVVATMSIYTDVGGRPGVLLGSGSGTVGEITGASPTCLTLNASPALTAGTKYWAVFSGNGSVNWLFWRETAKEALASNNGGLTWSPRAAKTFSLRVDTGSACAPAVSPNPASGTQLKDMYAKPGTSSFNTITIGNSGTKTLKLLGAAFSGTNAGSFRLLRGEPNGPENQPFPFPNELGANAEGVRILYVVCDGTLPQGQRNATLTLITDDPVRSSLSWTVWCLVDSTPPSVAFSDSPDGRAGWHLKSPASVTVRGVDPESGDRVIQIGCTDSAGPPLSHNSGSVATFNLAGDGVHNLACQAKDVAGNVGITGAYKRAVKIDTLAPNATKTNGPSSQTASTAATFVWTSVDAASGVQDRECRIDGGAYGACTSPATRSGLADGSHVFEVRIRDAAGHYDATPARWEWRVDKTAPTTTLAGGPSNPTTASTATFTVTASDASGTGVKSLWCSLDDAAPAACPADGTFSGLAEGHHKLRAWATDMVGNTGDAAVAEWDVDLTAPTAAFSEQPAGTTEATAATFAFAAQDAGPAAVLRYECRLDGTEFTVCASPATLDGLAVGEHAFEVRAVDTLGNVQVVPARATWTIVAPASPPSSPSSPSSPSGVPAPGTSPGGSGSVPGATLVTAAGDTTAPVVTKIKVKRRRLSLRLSEAGKTTVVFRQRSKRSGKYRTRSTRELAGKTGRNTLRILRKLRAGRYRVVVVAVDASGNAAEPKTATVRI